MSAQGWTPGSFLGARNAAQADMFTSASAQHIKVTLKDDTFGLGAKARRDPLNEPTGLDAFKGLLGRLNGKSDTELETEKRHRDDIKLARYAATKWQEVRFVSAGYLVQEKPDSQDQDRCKDRSASRVSEEKSSLDGSSTFVGSPRITSEETGDELTKKKRRSKAEKRSKSEEKQSRKKSKKRKLERESESLSKEDSDQSGSFDEQDTTRKEEDVTPETTAIATIRTRERLPLGRQVFRGRHIAQKKKALLDDKSLNEIFMIKA